MIKDDKTPPAVILLGAQLGENIGTTARAMHNFRLCDLRLVAPRQGWSRAKAEAAATSGAKILKSARMFPSLEEALIDLDYVIAATARTRDMNKIVLTPEESAKTLSAHKKTGILFGAESSGLDNESISLCDEIVEIPANPEFSSLNLAQAVLLISYQWFRAERALSVPNKTALATKEEMLNFFSHLETELDGVRFFRPEPKRPIMVRHLRNIFHRAHLSSGEIKALRGVIAALVGDQRSKRKKV
jgi:tRNA/rRNA methyltransferase